MGRIRTRRRWLAVITAVAAVSLLGSDKLPAAAGETSGAPATVADAADPSSVPGPTGSAAPEMQEPATPGLTPVAELKSPESEPAAAASAAPVTSPPDFGRIAKRRGVRVRTHVVAEEYGNARTLDVYRPRGVRAHSTPRPTVILVHGGAWLRGDRTDLEKQAVQLADLGYVVASVNYRLATETTAEGQRDDVNAAIEFVRQNASRLLVDTDRMVLLGSSAGGQLAASVATAGSDPGRFRGLVTLSGLLDPLYMAGTNPDYVNGVVPNLLLRCLPLECPDQYRAASAVHQLDPTDPPSLLFHSEKEKSWGPEQARNFHRAAQAVGVDSRLVVLPGRKHGIALWNEIFPILRDWLAQRL